MNEQSVSVYITPDGRQVPIPAELVAKTKFNKDGLPDRRSKANAEFMAWADTQDKAQQCPECGEVGRHADDCGTGGVMGNPVAQAYARRIWEGQSVDLPDHVRRERVRVALEAQGWTMEGVTL